MLKINNFSKTYGNNKKKAVDNLSLEVKKGEIFGFIGPNGAGKTTTIKAIVEINEIETGDILVDGVSIKDKPLECKMKMAYIPDNPDLYLSLTGIEYLNFIADIYNVPKAEREKLINENAKDFEILNNLGDLISTYSHGMRQKLVIISALIHNPKLLVLDEPFVGLDPKASFILKQKMNDLCKNGSSIFFSSHVLEVVEKLCDRIGIIKNGKLVACGSVSEVIGNKTLESIFLELD